MMGLLDPDVTRAKTICLWCAATDYLAREIREEWRKQRGSYCGNYQESTLVGGLVDRISIAYRDDYSSLRGAPLGGSFSSCWQRSADELGPPQSG